MNRFILGAIAVVATLTLAWGANNYRISNPGGVVTTLKSTDNAGVHTPHVNVDTGTLDASGKTTTMAAVAPTTPTFSSLLASSSTRKGCLVQNTGTTLGYVYFGINGSATTGNSFQVPSGQSISCNAGPIVLTDNVSGTCASGTCAFIVSSQ